MTDFTDRLGRTVSRVAMVAATLVGWPLLGANADEPSYSSTVERLVTGAQKAEVAGDTAEQFSLLREAARIEPDNQLIRWQLGQLKVGEQWMTVEESQRQTALDPKQAEYRQLRAEFGDKVAGQLALARWCRQNGLEDEARFHWASVLADQPNHREALRALEARWENGKLLTRDERDDAKREEISVREANRQWRSRVSAWVRVLNRERDSAAQRVAEEAIRAISDPAAIPAVEAATLGSDPAGKSQTPGIQRLSLAFLGALEAMDAHAATESLVRHAVVSSSAVVRDEATELLRKRPLHDFVPILLEGLAMPIESSYQVVTSNDGSVHYLHSLYREGSQNDWKHEITRAAFLRSSARRIAARLANDISQGTIAANVREAGRGVSSAAAFSSQFQREAAAAEVQVADMNRTTEALNRRIIPVLRAVSRKDLGAEPRAWWDWWTEENGYLQQNRPVYETNDSTYAQYVPPELPVGRSAECFAAGTDVWTKSGLQPIETLTIGELVLAQDVNTGELAYKPVVGRTVRPPELLLKFAVGRDTVTTTKGHPFWVAGVGWRMAKELREAAVLHGVTGSMRIESIQESAPAEAYNLVVADFSTYFVGTAGLLVHDNTPRRPTRAVVPGLAMKLAAAEADNK